MADDIEEAARLVAAEFAATPRPLHATKQCRHYSYDRDKGASICAWGFDLSAPKASNVCMPVGLQDGRVCPSREEFTDVERAAWDEWASQRSLRALAIMSLIPGTSRKRDIHWGTTGKFDCPGCQQGSVSWVRTKVNGHVHARCSTPGCFDVMQ